MCATCFADGSGREDGERKYCRNGELHARFAPIHRHLPLSRSPAGAAARQARADLARALATLAPSSADGVAPTIEVKSPARGQVLRIRRESGGPIAAGTALIEMGDVAQIEIVADLLSSDAALVRAGAKATVSGWGGGEPLPARVRRVDPAGFTKVSALGLEEQRVRVVLDFTQPPPEGLGHDYWLNVAIVVWEGNDVLRISSAALFRSGADWASFVLADGRARLRELETGASDGTMTLVTSGISEGETVILQPSDALHDGMRVSILRELLPWPAQ